MNLGYFGHILCHLSMDRVGSSDGQAIASAAELAAASSRCGELGLGGLPGAMSAAIRFIIDSSDSSAWREWREWRDMERYGEIWSVDGVWRMRMRSKGLLVSNYM